MSDVEKFHDLAKDAGNRLRSYILSVSSGAAGVFFFSLANHDSTHLQTFEKWLLSISIVSFVLTVAISLFELRIDAQRFFALGKELEKPEDLRIWDKIESYKSKRYKLINTSYITLSTGVLTTGIYLVWKIVSN
ncbi:MAG: hypothetical protein JXR91_13025 [Deltaproteobacteria bacterium]|nr:hypothetical protein [Deltaproteobacteria bacterium]